MTESFGSLTEYNFLLVPLMGILSYDFMSNAQKQWMEQTISSPQDLTAFTMIFQILIAEKPRHPGQIACYGDRSDDCRLSVVMNANLSLEITIESTR